jgi:hypothetical protein
MNRHILWFNLLRMPVGVSGECGGVSDEGEGCVSGECGGVSDEGELGMSGECRGVSDKGEECIR